MKKSLMITFVVLSGLLLINTASAVEVTLFGPEQYLRTKGPANVYTDTFSATPGKGILVIKNGTEDGQLRVSSALVFVNGEQIFGPSDFNQQVYHLERSINLTADSSIGVIPSWDWLTRWTRVSFSVPLTEKPADR